MFQSTLRLNLFGVPTLIWADNPVPMSPSSMMLCAYLALAPRHGWLRSAAAAQLFADCSAAKARCRLNTALWRLKAEVRSSTGVELVASTAAQCIGLSPAVDVTIDVSLFEELVAPVLRVPPPSLTQADASRLERAISLRRGQLLAPCHDEWVISERYRVESLYVSALDYLIQYCGAHAMVTAVAKYGELALDLEPLREDVHRHLMFAFGAAGRDDLVERQFERCRMVLLRELGADPMPETVAAYARLRRDSTAKSTTVAALVAELERARRDVVRLAATVDRALDQLRRMP
jgi:DNA-binding SARP family transcriptional activator